MGAKRICNCAGGLACDGGLRLGSASALQHNAAHPDASQHPQQQSSAPAPTLSQAPAVSSSAAAHKPAFLRRAFNTSTKPKLQHYYTLVKTQDEQRLFYELYSEHTNGAQTNWLGMVAEWNMRVANTQPNAPGGDIYVKSEVLLRKHAAQLTLKLRQRYAAAFDAQARVNRPGGSAFVPPPAAQQTLSSLMRHSAETAVRKTNQPAAPAAPKRSGSKAPKKCGFCEQPLLKGGSHQSSCIWCSKCSRDAGYDPRRTSAQGSSIC